MILYGHFEKSQVFRDDEKIFAFSEDIRFLILPKHRRNSK